MQFTQQRLVPTFTKVGFEKVKIPAGINAKLQKAVADAVENFDQLRYNSMSIIRIFSFMSQSRLCCDCCVVCYINRIRMLLHLDDAQMYTTHVYSLL